MTENDLVSVIIPTYKRPDVLSRSIDSVLNQSYGNIEIIVVDDNDPDSEFRQTTARVMQLYESNGKVRYIQHERNKNGSAARNTGFRASRGAYIMFLDDDDEFFPTKIESQISCLKERDESWGVCYTEYVRKNDNGEIVAVCGEKREGSLLKEVLARNLFVHAGSNLMIRRSVIEEINGFDESFKRNQDIEFLARILKKYKIAYVPTVGLIVHVHRASPSGNIDVNAITEHYLATFRPMIETLSASEQEYIYELIDLQLFRYFLLGYKDIFKAYEIIKRKKISIITVLKYLHYMLKRKITKKAYGFSL